MSVEDKVVYTFTGQGSQRIGMWDDLRAFHLAEGFFRTADRRLGTSLSTLCRVGPIEELTRTSNAQPAIVAHSLAAFITAIALHHEELPKPSFHLGHSVGEFSALAAAGVIDGEAAVYLVRQRGLLMEGVNGQMAVILGKDLEEVEELCRQSGAEVANINCPGQIVFSGSQEQISTALGIANDRRARLLPVSGPFHSSLMVPLRTEFRQILDDVSFRDAITPVILNVNAEPETRADVIKQMLVEQLASPVCWWQSVEYAIAHGVTTFVEFGPSDTLTGLLKRINPDVRGFAVTNYESAKALRL